MREISIIFLRSFGGWRSDISLIYSISSFVFIIMQTEKLYYYSPPAQFIVTPKYLPLSILVLLISKIFMRSLLSVKSTKW